MKGKKKDYEFISSFMEDCIKNNLFSQDEILNFAKEEIKKIDDYLINAENLKKKRSKILDVVCMLDKSKIKTNYEYLNFFNIKNIDLSIEICKIISSNICKVNEIYFLDPDQTKINSLLKDLCINKIIIIQDDVVKKGPLFKIYMEEILKLCKTM